MWHRPGLGRALPNVPLKCLFHGAIFAGFVLILMREHKMRKNALLKKIAAKESKIHLQSAESVILSPPPPSNEPLTTRVYDLGTNGLDKRLFKHLNGSNLEQSFLSRKIRIRRMCESAATKSSVNFPLRSIEFFINHEFKIIWCNIFKAASTTWIHYFLNMLDLTTEDINKLRMNRISPVELARTKFYPRPTPDQLYSFLNKTSYISFLIVRDPLERLLSAYRDKIETKNRNTKVVRCLITQMFSIRSIRRCKPTFAEFVDYIIAEHQSKKMIPDEHWVPISRFCTPCKVNYDYIIHFENLNEEQNFMLEKNPELSKKLAKKKLNSSHTNYMKISDKYFSQISPQHMRILMDQIYAPDFELFGYDKSYYHKYLKPSNRTMESMFSN